MQVKIKKLKSPKCHSCRLVNQSFFCHFRRLEINSKRESKFKKVKRQKSKMQVKIKKF